MSFLSLTAERGRAKIIVSATIGAIGNVLRQHPSGKTFPVRGMSFKPLSGGHLIGWDHEMPIGREVTYIAEIYGPEDLDTPLDSTTATFTWTTDSDWLKDPREPSRNIQVRVSEMGDAKFTTPTSIHPVLNRPDPIAIGDVRQAEANTITFLTMTQEEADRLFYILASGNALLFQSTPTSRYGNTYLQPLDLTLRSRPRRDEPVCLWDLDFQEVRAPVGEPGAFITWQTALDAGYTTRQSIIDAGHGTLVEFIESLSGSTSGPIVAYRGA